MIIKLEKKNLSPLSSHVSGLSLTSFSLSRTTKLAAKAFKPKKPKNPDQSN
jgi:hypothetical protein